MMIVGWMVRIIYFVHEIVLCGDVYGLRPVRIRAVVVIVVKCDLIYLNSA